MVIVSLVKTTENEITLLAGNNNDITGFESVRKGLDYYENSYGAKHRQSYEGSMSATLNYCIYQPSIVTFEDFNALVNDLFNGNTKANLIRMSSISGSLNAFKIPNQDNAKVLWENGIKPQLINDKMLIK